MRMLEASIWLERRKKYETSESELKAFAYKVIRYYMKHGEINWGILKTEIFDLKSD